MLHKPAIWKSGTSISIIRVESETCHKSNTNKIEKREGFIERDLMPHLFSCGVLLWKSHSGTTAENNFKNG